MSNWSRKRKEHPHWIRLLPAHALAAMLSRCIPGITIYEKFTEVGWVTLLVASLLYERVGAAIQCFEAELPGSEVTPNAFGVGSFEEIRPPGDPDPKKPVAAPFVGRCGALERHALFALLHMFPRHFDEVVFIGVACVDTNAMLGKRDLDAKKHSGRSLHPA